MTLIKAAGIAILGLGLLVIALTLISAKKNRTFEAIKELKRIRATGYIKEHKEQRGEDIYKKELATDHSRLLSRRAKRVLERMEAEEGTSANQPGRAKGTSLLEQVPARRQNENTGVLPDARNEKATDILEAKPEKMQPELKGVIERDAESTGVLHDPAESTAVLKKEGENTAVLERKEDTGILIEAGEGTDVLDRRNESTGILEGSEERTAVLAGSEEGTALLYKPEGDATDILSREEVTGVLRKEKQKQ